jgi:hypothetical protein
MNESPARFLQSKPICRHQQGTAYFLDTKNTRINSRNQHALLARFNNPLLWIKKIQAAKALGLDNYANAAQEELSQWLSLEEIEKMLGANN